MGRRVVAIGKSNLLMRQYTLYGTFYIFLVVIGFGQSMGEAAN